MPKIEFEGIVRSYPTKNSQPRFQMSIPKNRPVKPGCHYKITMVELTTEGLIAEGSEEAEQNE